MAANPEVFAPRLEVVELTRVSARELGPLLSEEMEVWDRRYSWDFSASVDLLRRYVNLQSLYGYALRAGNQVIGYTYFVCENRKGLIGDFFISEEFAEPAVEQYLLEMAVSALMRTSGVRRIECQLMLLKGQNATLPFQQFLSRYDRIFMEISGAAIEQLAETDPVPSVTLVPWAERYAEEIAHLVASAYKGHVDSKINDQYRNIPGARHFLTNIIRYPGCGIFSGASSTVALDRRTGRVCGVCLASLISATSGHVTQLCVLPALRGTHLGYHLIRRSLRALMSAGCSKGSLTVTCSNVTAIRLYESLGFTAKGLFPALVWEGF